MPRGRPRHPLPKVLPIRLTNEMFENINLIASNLEVRPHDIARVALGIGLQALYKHNDVTQKLLADDITI